MKPQLKNKSSSESDKCRVHSLALQSAVAAAAITAPGCKLVVMIMKIHLWPPTGACSFVRVIRSCPLSQFRVKNYSNCVILARAAAELELGRSAAETRTRRQPTYTGASKQQSRPISIMKGFNVFLSLQVEYLITPFVLYYGEQGSACSSICERHKDKIIARRSGVAFHTHPHACTPIASGGTRFPPLRPRVCIEI
jgi:hypothetical protein